MTIFRVLGIITQLNYDIWEVAYRKGSVFKIEGEDKSTDVVFQLSVDKRNGVTNVRYGETTLFCHYTQIEQILSTLPKSDAPLTREKCILYHLCLYLKDTEMNFHLVNSLSKRKGVSYTFNDAHAIGVSFNNCEATSSQLCAVRHDDKNLEVPYRHLVPYIINFIRRKNTVR